MNRSFTINHETKIIIIMISVHSKHIYNMFIGKKLLEVRKWLPKNFDKLIAKGYRFEVHMYCTKGKPYLVRRLKNYIDLTYYYDLKNEKIEDNKVYTTLNGKVVGKFWFDEYDTINSDGTGNYYNNNPIQDIINKSCLTYEQLLDYGKGKPLYAWHIKDLTIFDRPRELKEYVKWNKETKWTPDMNWIPVQHAPQRMTYVYEVIAHA